MLVQFNRFGFGPAWGYAEWRKEQEAAEEQHMVTHQCSNCRLVFVKPLAEHQQCGHTVWAKGCCHRPFASEDDDYCIDHSPLYT